MTPSNTSYCEIPLTQGQVALVDPEDFERISKYKWHACWNPLTGTFYASRNINVGDRQNRRGMHAEVLNLPQNKEITADHINQFNTLDNRKSNLRLATQAQQSANRRMYKSNTSGYKGVQFRKERPNRAAVSISVNKKRIHLGYFPKERVIEAARAYDAAAKKYFGEFACLNFPEH